MQSSAMGIRVLQSGTNASDSSREDEPWPVHVLRRVITHLKLQQSSGSTEDGLSRAEEDGVSWTAIESTQESSRYSATLESKSSRRSSSSRSGRGGEFSWTARRTHRRRGGGGGGGGGGWGGGGGRGDWIVGLEDNQRDWAQRDGDYMKRIDGDYMERIGGGEGIRQQMPLRRGSEIRRRGGSPPSVLSHSLKSPLEKAMDSASVWVADVSASVAESVPPAVDKARRVLSTQVAALPARLYQILPPLSSPHSHRLALLLSSSFLLLLLLLRHTATRSFLAAACAAVQGFFAPVVRAVSPAEGLRQQEEKAEQKAQQQQQQQQQQNQQSQQQNQQSQQQTGKSRVGESGDSAAVVSGASGFDGGYGGGGVNTSRNDGAEDVHETMLALEMSQVDATDRSGGNSGESLKGSFAKQTRRSQVGAANRTGKSGEAGEAQTVMRGAGSQYGNHTNRTVIGLGNGRLQGRDDGNRSDYRPNQRSDQRSDYRSDHRSDQRSDYRSDLVPDWWQEAWAELALQGTRGLATGSETGSGSGRGGQAGLGGHSIKNTQLAVMGALEQFNSQGHIPPEALTQIWAAWRASGDTWQTQRDSVRMIVFNAAVQLALDACMGTDPPPRLPASGPSFLVVMAAAISLPAPSALAGSLRGVASRVTAELVACNELIEASMRGEAEVKLQGISNLLSEFTPAAVSPEMATSANLLREMLPRREREELAWMYEKATGAKHVAIVKRVLGL
ncbi:hypothetical protein CLOM_g3849 [Closterium sp. NIES-68]|nr:hypothetical protein CLOM_g3849 [Closterium sp. NIES-68]